MYELNVSVPGRYPVLYWYQWSSASSFHKYKQQQEIPARPGCRWPACGVLLSVRAKVGSWLDSCAFTAPGRPTGTRQWGSMTLVRHATQGSPEGEKCQMS